MIHSNVLGPKKRVENSSAEHELHTTNFWTIEVLADWYCKIEILLNFLRNHEIHFDKVYRTSITEK